MLAAPVVLILLSTAGESEALLRSCDAEIEARRGISRDEGDFLPFYKDFGLIAYLTRLVREARGATSPSGPFAVLPVFTTDRLCFRRGNRVYLSTAWVLESRTEQDLLNALAAAPESGGRKRNRMLRSPPSACALLSVPHLEFEEVRGTLERAVARYREMTERRLRRR